MKRKVDESHEAAARAKIEKKYKERQDLLVHIAAFVCVNIMVWMIFLASRSSFPWPIFVTGGWGIGFVSHIMHYYDNHGAGAKKKEAEIEAEIERQYRLARMERESDWAEADEEAHDEARVYDLDRVKPSTLRLSDDGELVDHAPLDESETKRRRQAQ